MGTVDECVEQLQKHVATGVDRLIFVPYRYQDEQLEIIAREIIPRLKKS
jgi:alkanesulfonate monooxygenase